MNSTEQCVFATKSASTPYVPAHLSSPITLLLPIESLSNSCQEKIKLKVWSLNSKDPRVKTWRTFEPPSLLISSEASDPSIGNSTLTWNTQYTTECRQNRFPIVNYSYTKRYHFAVHFKNKKNLGYTGFLVLLKPQGFVTMQWVQQKRCWQEYKLYYHEH